MGYSKVDEVAINTIRLLAVSSSPDGFGGVMRAEAPSTATSTTSIDTIQADMNFAGRCHIRCELGSPGSPYVSAPGDFLSCYDLGKLNLLMLM